MDHTEKQHVELIPKAALRGLFGLVFAVFVMVGLARYFEMPPTAMPEEAPIVAQRSIYLSAQMSGQVTVMDEFGTLIAELSAEEGGFISGVARVIERERRMRTVPQDGLVTVIWRENGRLSIYDPSTLWTADLMGFGQDNARAFAQLVAPRK